MHHAVTSFWRKAMTLFSGSYFNQAVSWSAMIIVIRNLISAENLLCRCDINIYQEVNIPLLSSACNERFAKKRPVFIGNLNGSTCIWPTSVEYISIECKWSVLQTSHLICSHEHSRHRVLALLEEFFAGIVWRQRNAASFHDGSLKKNKKCAVWKFTNKGK